MLRYYEDLGLLIPNTRTEAGYRSYGADALARIGFIQRAKSLGLSLREIQQLVEPADSSTELARLRHAITHKVADVQRRIAELESLRQELEALYRRLDNSEGICGHIGDCECWLPTGKEVNQMTTTIQVRELVVIDPAHMQLMSGQAEQTASKPAMTACCAEDSTSCGCCGCSCPGDEGACSCCGCPNP